MIDVELEVLPQPGHSDAVVGNAPLAVRVVFDRLGYEGAHREE
jgi:hypothetical protein